MNDSDKWWESGKSYFGFDKGKSKYKSSLGWEESKLYDNYYTSYSRSTYSYPTSKEEDTEKINNLEKILNKAYQSTRDMIVILDFPFPVDIDFEGKYNPIYDSRKKWSDRRRIFIPTNIFDEPDSKYSESDKIGIFCGQGVHEAAHLKFTTFQDYKTFMRLLEVSKLSDEERRYCDADCNSLVNLVQLFINIIEDERVEDALLKERPGYSQFIIKTKNWKYNLFEQHLAKSLERVAKSEGESLKFIANVIKLIRFPENIDFDFIEKYPDAFNEFVEALKVTPKCTLDSCNLGYCIYAILKNHFSEFSKEEDSIKSLQKVLGGTSFLKGAFETTTEEILYGKDNDWGDQPKSSMEKISKGVQKNPIIGKVVTQKAFRGESDGTFFIKPENRNKDSYKKIAKSVKKYVPSIRKLIKIKDKNYDFNIYGCRSGVLDTNKLAEAYQGVSQVYVRQGKVSTPKTTVCILVDESGSMERDYKAEHAREAAVLINEALKGLPGLDLYIYGHTADQNWEGSTELLIYKEGNTGDENSLVDIHGRKENRDGVAIKEAAARVRKFTDSHCLMFVISDGMPCACNYWGVGSIRDVRKKVDEVRKDNFDIIQITIDGDGGDIENSKIMFGKKYVVDLRKDLSQLPLELSKIIKKYVLNNMGSSTTL